MKKKNLELEDMRATVSPPGGYVWWGDRSDLLATAAHAAGFGRIE
ncbi:hypothetical protein PWR63_01815 [Paraburkholderia sp. A2WS-5]